MVSVRTEELKRAAEALEQEAAQYDSRRNLLGDCIRWMGHQEYAEKEQLRRYLSGCREELTQQKHKLRLLAQALYRIAEKYDKTEQKLVDDEKFYRDFSGYAYSVLDLEYIRDILTDLGIQTVKQ